jgi:outer membrane protein
LHHIFNTEFTMKKFIGITILSALIIFVGQNAMAQNIKFGHINSDELIQALPEFDSANVKLEKFRKDLINALELMTVELNNKSDVYNKESKNLTDLVKQTKEQELVDMNKRIQEFQNNAQQQLQSKQAELFQPIMAKVDKAIKDVGKENGFLYIFSIGQGSSLLFFDEAKSTNIMPLAKAKLGLK